MKKLKTFGEALLTILALPFLMALSVIALLVYAVLVVISGIVYFIRGTDGSEDNDDEENDGG